MQASAPAEKEEKIMFVLPGPQLAHTEAELNLHGSVDTTRQPGTKIFYGEGELCGGVRRDSYMPLLIESHSLQGEVMSFVTM